MGEPNGHYPSLDVFALDNNSPQMSDDLQIFKAQLDATDVKLRRHAACDECRKRKLKCSGEPTGCSRCVKNGIRCVYSQQKQMGRPRKRQRTDEESRSPVSEEIQYAYPPPLPPSSMQPQSHIETQTETPIDPSLANIDQDLTDFQNVCTGPLAQAIRGQREAEVYRGNPTTANFDVLEHNGDATGPNNSNTRYPTDINLWPDFSTIDKLPLPLTTRYGPDPSNDLDYTTPSAPSMANNETPQSQQPFHFDPDADPSALSALPSVPACPCLPNLYLALSTLSTLTSYPVTQETVMTLLSAHRTAHSVIYCPVCPQEFQTGSQNLMLGCTLLNVLADAWHRVRDTNTETLKKGFGSAPTPDQHNSSHSNGSNGTSYLTFKEGQAWRAFVRQLIRAYVFGDATIPAPPSSSSVTPETPSQPGIKVCEQHTLKFLISALERRQRQWHNLDPPTDEFPDRGACSASGPLKNGVGKSPNGHRKSSAASNGEIPDGESAHGHTHEYQKGHHFKNHDHDGYLCIGIVHQSRNIMREMDDTL